VSALNGNCCFTDVQVVGRCFVPQLASIMFLLYFMNHMLSQDFVFLGNRGLITYSVSFNCIMSH